jgi:hypothetical protein
MVNNVFFGQILCTLNPCRVLLVSLSLLVGCDNEGIHQYESQYEVSLTSLQAIEQLVKSLDHNQIRFNPPMDPLDDKISSQKRQRNYLW